MRRLLIALLLWPSLAQAIAILPGGNGGGPAASGTVVIGSTTTCLNGEGAVSNGTAWACTSVAAGSGDSATINGSPVTDINILDTAGDGGIIWTRDTAPNPDTATAVVKDAAISVAKLKSADFGDFTCNGSSCTVDTNAITLATQTTGAFLKDIGVGTGLSCNGCGVLTEDNIPIIDINLAATMTWTGIQQFSASTGLLIPPSDTFLPTINMCDASHGVNSIRVDSDAPKGAKLNVCLGTGGWETVSAGSVSIAGSNVANPNFLNTADITFTPAGSDISATVNANAIALGAKTTGNYVAAVAGSGHVTCSGCTAAEGVTGTLGVSGLDSGDMAATLDYSGKTGLLVPTSATPTTTAAGQIAFDTNAWGTSRGAPQIFDGTANAYLVGILASDTCLNGQVPTFNTGGTWTCEANGAIPAGTSTELQYRAGVATLGAVPGTSVSSGNITMTGTHTAAQIAATATTAEPGNRIQLTSNDTAFVNDPTCANSGTANKITLIDKDETAADTWVICDGTSELFNLSVPSLTPTMLTTAAKTQTLCASNVSILSAAVSIDLGEVLDAGTVRSISCLTRGTITTAPQFNLTECATDGSSCDNMTTSAIACGNTKTSSTTFGGTEGASIAAGAILQATSANTPSVTAGLLMFCVDWTPN